VSPMNGPPAHALVVGLANAYFQYLTTREEYGIQTYEGASTLYGPASTDYFAERFSLLARSMMGLGADAKPAPGGPRMGEAEAFEYDPGPVRSRLPDPEDAPSLATLGAQRRPRGLCRLPQRAPPGICFWWSDGSPARVGIQGEWWLRLVRASSSEPVRACQAQKALPSPWETRCDPGALVDDRGLSFEVRVHRRDGDGFLWSAVFHASPEQWASIAEAGSVQIEAAGAEGADAIRSKTFGTAALPPPCSVEAMRFCLGDSEGESH